MRKAAMMEEAYGNKLNKKRLIIKEIYGVQISHF